MNPFKTVPMIYRAVVDYGIRQKCWTETKIKSATISVNGGVDVRGHVMGSIFLSMFRRSLQCKSSSSRVSAGVKAVHCYFTGNPSAFPEIEVTNPSAIRSVKPADYFTLSSQFIGFK